MGRREGMVHGGLEAMGLWAKPSALDNFEIFSTKRARFMYISAK